MVLAMVFDMVLTAVVARVSLSRIRFVPVRECGCRKDKRMQRKKDPGVLIRGAESGVLRLVDDGDRQPEGATFICEFLCLRHLSLDLSPHERGISFAFVGHTHTFPTHHAYMLLRTSGLYTK